MKTRRAIFVVMLAALLLPGAWACVPVMPNPEADAHEAGAIFYGAIVAERTIPGPGPMLELGLTVKTSAVLRGFAPGRMETRSGCGGPPARKGERVIILRVGRQYVIRPAGGEYERRLRVALGHGS